MPKTAKNEVSYTRAQNALRQLKEEAMLYKDWLDEWLTLYVKTSTKPRTYDKYLRQTQLYILPELGGYAIEDLTAVTLQRFSAGLSAKGLAANTVNGIISVLKASLKKSVALGVAERQFSDCIVRPRPREKKVNCFNAAEQRKIEDYIFKKRSPRLFGIVICLYTGLRIGELLALTWADVDFGQGIITVTKSCHDSWQNGRYLKILDTPKTQNSERIIPIPRRLLVYLKQLKKSARCPFVVAGKTEQGAQVRSYQKSFEVLQRQLNIPHRGFHALRHTFATRALEVGMDVKTLAEILGHKNPVITLQRYAHSLIEHKAEMMNRVGKLLQ